MITETLHPTTKAAVAKTLAELGVELSPSRVKKTSLADLTRMLDQANAKPQLTTRKVEEAAFDAAGNVTVRTTEEATHAELKKARRAASNVVPIAPAKKRKSAGVNLQAKDASQLRACRARSKQAILIDHLAKGATLAELVAALKPWSESSVKSALYWDVAKVKGYGVRTETADDGTRTGLSWICVIPLHHPCALQHVTVKTASHNPMGVVPDKTKIIISTRKRRTEALARSGNSERER
jgi:hypothetical protein